MGYDCFFNRAGLSIVEPPVGWQIFSPGWVTLLSAVGLTGSGRCTHWSDRMESLAFGRAFMGAADIRGFIQTIVN